MITPERVWHFADNLRPYLPGGGRIMMGDTEYVRADITAATVADNARLRADLAEARAAEGFANHWLDLARAELAQVTAANAALVVRLERADGLLAKFLEWWPEGARVQPPEAYAARAYLNGKDE